MRFQDVFKLRENTVQMSNSNIYAACISGSLITPEMNSSCAVKDIVMEMGNEQFLIYQKRLPN